MWRRDEPSWKPEIPPRVDFWLTQWARWMRVRPSDEMELGYPSRVKPWIGGGESQRGDDWSEAQEFSIWQTNCQTMNALIESLPPTQQGAVCHVYAGDCWRFPRNNLMDLLFRASEALLIGMNARAVI